MYASLELPKRSSLRPLLRGGFFGGVQALCFVLLPIFGPTTCGIVWVSSGIELERDGVDVVATVIDCKERTCTEGSGSSRRTRQCFDVVGRYEFAEQSVESVVDSGARNCKQDGEIVEGRVLPRQPDHFQARDSAKSSILMGALSVLFGVGFALYQLRNYAEPWIRWLSEPPRVSS